MKFSNKKNHEKREARMAEIMENTVATVDHLRHEFNAAAEIADLGARYLAYDGIEKDMAEKQSAVLNAFNKELGDNRVQRHWNKTTACMAGALATGYLGVGFSSGVIPVLSFDATAPVTLFVTSALGIAASAALKKQNSSMTQKCEAFEKNISDHFLSLAQEVSSEKQTLLSQDPQEFWDSPHFVEVLKATPSLKEEFEIFVLQQRFKKIEPSRSQPVDQPQPRKKGLQL